MGCTESTEISVLGQQSPSATGIWGPGTELGHTPFRSSVARWWLQGNVVVLSSPRCMTPRSSSHFPAVYRSKVEDCAKLIGQTLSSSRMTTNDAAMGLCLSLHKEWCLYFAHC